MDNFLVAHLQKFNVQDLIPMEIHLNHAARSSSNKDIDKTLTHLNYDICDIHEEDGCKLREKVREKINNRSNNETKLRKDAVAFCSVVVSASADFFRDKTPEQIQNYFEAAKDGLDEIFGNCVVCMVHMDERGREDGTVFPHMHYVFVPLTKDNELCAKKIVTRLSLTKLQDNLATYLQHHGYDVRRGIKNSPLSHIVTRKWKRDQLLKEMKQEELAQKLNVPTHAEKKLFGFGESNNLVIDRNDFSAIMEIADQAVSWIENNSEIIRRRNEMIALQRDLDKQRKEIVKKMQVLQQRSEEILSESQRLADLDRHLTAYEKVLQSQDQSIELQHLADDLDRQQKQLKKQQIEFDKKIVAAVQRVREASKKAVLKEVEEQEQFGGQYAVESMKALKEHYPQIWNDVVKIAGKKLMADKVNLKLKKTVEEEIEKILPKE